MTVDLVKNTAGAASPSRSAGALSPARSTGGVPAAAANHLVARQASPTATLQATKTLLDETTAPEDEERTMAFNPTSDTQTIHNHHSHLSHELQDHVMNDDSVADLSVNPQSGLDESEIIANPVEMEQSDAPVLDESNMISGDFVENSGATDPHQSAFAAVPVSAPLSASADIAATPASSSAAPTATKTNTAPEGPRDPFLVKEQFKWLNKTIANFKKKREAYIFLSPVDPVALNIPQYFSIITHPMDVSTIEKKLNSHVYTFADEAIADFDLMFTNCLTFNGSDGSANAVSLLALNAQAWFQKEVPKMPKTYADAIAATQKKRPGRPSDAGARSSLPRTATSATAGEPGLDAPAKRRIAAASGAKKNGPEMKFCQYIHRELTKKQNFEYNWPFLAPVDPIALGIPTYFNVVKRPMDLSTMKKKLDANEYYSSADYEADFRLMLDNCYKFNSVGTDVYILGQRFEALFNSKWGEKNSFLSQHGEPRVKSSHNLDDGEETDDEAYNMQMGNLRQQLQLTQKMIDDLIESKRRERDRRRQSVAPSASTVAAASALSYYPPAATGQPAPSSYAAKAQAKAKKPSKPRGRKKRAHVSSDDERMPDADITYEQKRELSDNINILPPDKLPQVFEIIKENANLGGVDDEEIELDIDSLEKPVLWKLYLFVKKHTRPPKRAKLDDQSGEQAAIGADASSSSEAESDDSDDAFQMTAAAGDPLDLAGDGVFADRPSQGGKGGKSLRKPKVSRSRVLSSASVQASVVALTTNTQISSSTSVSVAATTTSAVTSGRRGKSMGGGAVSPLPFRTEKGDITTYTSNFVTTAHSSTIASITASTLAATSISKAKPAAPVKKQPVSVLDLVFEIEKEKAKPEKKAPAKPKEITPAVKKSDGPASPGAFQGPSSAPVQNIPSQRQPEVSSTTTLDPPPRSPSPESDYVDPSEWLDLQGPADTLQSFATDVLAEHDDIPQQIASMRATFLAKMRREINEIGPEDLITNDVGHDIDYGNEASSDEDGAL